MPCLPKIVTGSHHFKLLPSKLPLSCLAVQIKCIYLILFYNINNQSVLSAAPKKQRQTSSTLHFLERWKMNSKCGVNENVCLMCSSSGTSTSGANRKRAVMAKPVLSSSILSHTCLILYGCFSTIHFTHAHIQDEG